MRQRMWKRQGVATGAGAGRRTRKRPGVVAGVLAGLVGGMLYSFGATPADDMEDTTGEAVAPEVRLYQLLYDYQTTEPMATLGQKVRILMWIRYLDLSPAQQELLLNLGRRYQSRREVVEEETARIVGEFEKRLEPVYQRIYEEIIKPVPDQRVLDDIAHELQGLIMAHSAEDELHAMRARMVRTILSDEESFLHTLSPEQEEKLVTSLFFLRRQIDPFANPETYRKVIGPTWNAGDFSALLRRNKPKDDHLNIGGLWNIDMDEENRINYADIRRPIVLFYVLKEPALVPALEESLHRARGGLDGQPSSASP